jgi:plastocyanin
MNTTLALVSTLAATAIVANAAEISGKVTLKGTPPPAQAIAAVKADANCGKFHSTDVMTRTFVVGADSGLGNVLVYIKGGLEGKSFPAPVEKPLIDQVGCMYEPYVSAVMAGQTFQLRNSDPIMHNIMATPKANKGFNFAQATAGQVNDKMFDKPELGVKLSCSVHPWMVSYVSVMENPFFAVTDKDGKFVIKGELPDGKYTVEAFHQKLGVAGAVAQEIEVKGGKASAAFTLELK